MNSLLPAVTLPPSALTVAVVKPAPTCSCTLDPKLPLTLLLEGTDSLQLQPTRNRQFQVYINIVYIYIQNAR